MDNKNILNEIWHLTVHNNDGQIVDYTLLKASSFKEIIFPEVLRSYADFTLVSDKMEIWLYDYSGTFDRELAVRFAKYLKSKEIQK